MPNIWAHLLFGQEVLREAGEQAAGASGYAEPQERQALQRILERPALLRLFNFGCQGPDFLFYHNFLPWKKDKKMERLGGAMHSRACGPMLLDMARYAEGRQPDDPLAVYVLGFLMHHVLDRNVHPYVFYRSGFRKWDHQRFEVAMDTLIVRKKLGLETWKTPVWKQFEVGRELSADIVAMLAEATARLYPELAGAVRPDDWQQAYRDMVSAQKLFHDPGGLKRALTFGRIEPFVYKRDTGATDYLNESHTEWRHPADRDIASTLSVWDMWDNALADGAAVMSAALAAIGGVVEGKRLAEALGDISYETGLPCDCGLDIRYAEPYAG